MLRNMRVSGKLITVLAAPVVVLVLLAAFGVNQRLDDARNAKRVKELTEFSLATTKLVTALQTESVWSTAFVASEGDVYKERLDTARAATDAEIDNLKAIETRVEPGRDAPGTQEALTQANNRLGTLPTNRNSVDSRQLSFVGVVDAFTNSTTDLITVNANIVQQANEPSLLHGLNTAVNLARIQNAKATEAALLNGVVVSGSFKDETGATCEDVNIECESFVRTTTAGAEATQAERTFQQGGATLEDKRILRDNESKSKFDELKKQVLSEGGNTNQVTVDPEAFGTAVLDQLGSLAGVESTFINNVMTEADRLVTDAQSAASLYLVGTLIAITAALIIAFLVARATTVPLRRLTSAAYTLSTERLPALVERLRNPEDDQDDPAASLQRIDISSKDEIGQLADAFNSIQQVTVEVAEEQAQLLRKGIGDIFINLARRNQTLLDRQIEFIDQLEAHEEDPDQLDNLFRLDHLATRMRRNAESLLVLAGAEPPRRRGRPVALADVVRVAIGEVEDFARIQLLALDDATVGGNVAVDLAHLLSELMENATHFSPPDTMVEIVGHRTEVDGYIISVSDQGIGMSADQLADANHQLTRPPLVGLALSRSLGFIVVGRLASRFGVSVKLTASPSGGVTALVTLPDSVVTYADGGASAPAPEIVEAAASTTEDIEVVEEEVVTEELDVESDVDDFEFADDLLDDIFEEPPLIPEGEEFDQGLQALVAEAEQEVEAEAAESPVAVDTQVEVVEPEPVVESAPVAETADTADVAEAKPLTAAGLVRRTPKQRSKDATGGAAPIVAARTTGATQRSPEEVRKMLSRYRSGLNRGRGSADGPSDES